MSFFVVAAVVVVVKASLTTRGSQAGQGRAGHACEQPESKTVKLATKLTTLHCALADSLHQITERLPRSLVGQKKVLRVGARTQEMWKDHVALTTEFPEASLPPGGGDDGSVSPDTVRRKRLVYRSKQRGWLEARLTRMGLDRLHVYSSRPLIKKKLIF